MEKIQETFNKDLEELKIKLTMMNNTITEIKNSIERINSRITEAGKQISDLEDKMVKITSALCLGAILNNAITNKKHRNAKNVALSRMQRGHLFTM